MNPIHFPANISKSGFFFGLLIAVMAAFALGCGRDEDVTIVDFSRTIAVEKPGAQSHEGGSLRVAVGAMISPKESFLYYRQLLDYVGKKLGLNAHLVQRKTYGEVNDLVGKGRIDLAFICSGPYATEREKFGFKLLATPRIRGSNSYQAYLIVQRDSPLHKLEDLRGKVFAFTDPESNTGKLVPTYWLSLMQERSESFFRKTIYTYSHDNSILAVSRGLVDAACVDGLVWEYYHLKNPAFTSNTRIIKKSQPYGNPPLVASKRLSQDLSARIKRVLFTIHLDSEGQKILQDLLIDRFIEPREEWYEPIRRMHSGLALMEEKAHGL